MSRGNIATPDVEVAPLAAANDALRARKRALQTFQ